MEEVGVLVVDDQELFRDAMAAVVDATDGFVLVGSVTTGEDALVVATTRLRPRLVLMDVNLPGIDGVEATRRLRAIDRPPVVVLVSSYDEGELDLLGCGAASYIAKSELGPDRLADSWARRDD
jgi:DNA-binding NarL/FixJ family response regulator